jgi:hypothetical protein
MICALAPARDDQFTALCANKIMQAVSTTGVADERLVSTNAAHQVAGGRRVVLLTGPRNKADQQAKHIDEILFDFD